MNILLDYFFPITAINPTPAASTAFLKQVLVVVKPKVGVTEDVISQCANMAAVAALTDNVESQQLFDAGMSKVYVLPVSDLLLADILVGHENDFFTILISSDFTDAEMDAATFGAFTGVVGMASTDDDKNALRAAIENRAAFHSVAANKAKNMFYAFGKLLSNALNWTNQQYITMPLADDIDEGGEAQGLFDDKVNFVIDDTQYGKRLGLFAAGGKAIVAPYIKKNLQIDLQSKALQYVSANQPDYTNTAAALLEDECQKVIESYITRKWIPAGKIDIKLEQDNFVASGYITITPPKAMWRVFGEIRENV